MCPTRESWGQVVRNKDKEDATEPVLGISLVLLFLVLKCTALDERFVFCAVRALRALCVNCRERCYKCRRCMCSFAPCERFVTPTTVPCTV